MSDRVTVLEISTTDRGFSVTILRTGEIRECATLEKLLFHLAREAKKGVLL